MERTGPSEWEVTRGGVPLHLVDWGGAAGGIPVVLLHGVAGNAWHWNALAPLLVTALGDRYRVVSLDQRGHGDSGKPARGYEPEEFALDVLAVQDHLGGQPMVLVGHSRGGWLAAYVAGRWPERVTQLILVDPARIRFDTAEDAEDFYGGVAKLLGPFASRDEALATARSREPDARWTELREEAFLAGLRQGPDGALLGKLPPAVLRQLREVREADDAVGALISHATMPVLLLVADKSDERRQNQKLEYARRLPQARVELLDSTHHIHQDQPDAAAQLIASFVADPVAGDTPR